MASGTDDTGAAAKGDVIAYFQDRFEDTLKQLRRDKNRAWWLARVHRWFAYILRAVAIFGGIAIAAGLDQTWSHIVGIMIAVAVGIDLWLQNFNRLLSVQDAANAYSELFSRIIREHVLRLGDVMLTRQSDEEKAKNQLVNLLQHLIEAMHIKMEEIEKAWTAADRLALQMLSMEQKKAV